MLRYGSVSYLNTAPLRDGLEEESGSTLRLEVPSRLVELLRAGEIDVALAPVVATFEDPSLVIVPAGAIAAHGPVESVLLFCRRPPQECEVVALDTSSRTSVELVKVLFAHRWGTRPRYVPRDPDPDLTRLDADAALLIGDPAMVARWGGPPPVDLAEEWRAWTGLPFVFAAWIARNAEIATLAEPVLRRVAERGMSHLRALAHQGALDLGLPEERVQRYLEKRLRFGFGDAERRGLERFHQLWASR